MFLKITGIGKVRLFFILCLLIPLTTGAQTTIGNIRLELVDTIGIPSFLVHKKIPEALKEQAIVALSHYPELHDVKIEFRLRKGITPLSSRPQIISVLKARKNRTYIITISTKSNKRFSPILFHNLPKDAQIGVLGHELGHVVTYLSKNNIQLMVLPFKLMNTKYTDCFEFNTDLIAIQHGLGRELYAWSSFVRQALDIEEWRGASKGQQTGSPVVNNERYMNPETIQKYMDSIPIYGSGR